MGSYGILGCRLPAGFRCRSGNSPNYLQLAGSYQVEKSEWDLSPTNKVIHWWACRSSGVDRVSSSDTQDSMFEPFPFLTNAASLPRSP